MAINHPILPSYLSVSYPFTDPAIVLSMIVVINFCDRILFCLNGNEYMCQFFIINLYNTYI